MTNDYKEPRWTTFAHSVEQIQLAIDAGATHLILEDSKCALRSYSDDFSTPGFEKFQHLADMATSLSKSITLSANVDILIHDRHIPILRDLCNTLTKSPIDTIRFQDPGVNEFLKQEFPHFKTHLATETGNNNVHSVSYYAQNITQQTISNELTHHDLLDIQAHLHTDLECQVHGPLLIQYSNRRFLAGAPTKTGETKADPNTIPPIYRLAEDNEYPKRYFPFYDNPHGHLMYLYFDRCLLQYMSLLAPLNLTSWLFDGRGQSESYLTTALKLYKKNWKKWTRNPKEWTLSKTDWAQLSQASPRPLKGGFFRANQTDRTWKRTVPTSLEKAQKAGIILNLEKGESLTIECYTTLHSGQNVTLCRPDGKQLEFQLHEMKDCLNNPIKSSTGHNLIKIPWKKSITPNSLLYLK